MFDSSLLHQLMILCTEPYHRTRRNWGNRQCRHCRGVGITRKSGSNRKKQSQR